MNLQAAYPTFIQVQVQAQAQTHIWYPAYSHIHAATSIHAHIQTHVYTKAIKPTCTYIHATLYAQTHACMLIQTSAYTIYKDQLNILSCQMLEWVIEIFAKCFSSCPL
mgnify:CR=1 FL=1